MPSKVGAKPWRTICRWLSTWRIFAARVVALVVHLQLWMLWRMVRVGLHRLQLALKLQLHHLLQMHLLVLFSLFPLFQLQKLVQMQMLHLLLFLLQRLRWQSYHRLPPPVPVLRVPPVPPPPPRPGGFGEVPPVPPPVPGPVDLSRLMRPPPPPGRPPRPGRWAPYWAWGDAWKSRRMNMKCMIWHDLAWFGMIWHDLAWFDMIWHDLTWFGMAWLGMIVACPCHWLLIGTCQVDTQSNIRRRPQEPFASCFGCFFF